MRAAIQALSLGLFTVLFALANYRLPDWLPADIYLRLDPLLGLSAIVAGRAWVPRAIWGLVLLVATVLVGRFFCSYVCPLGAILDFLDPLLFRRAKRRTLDADARLRNVKYVVLILFIAAALAGSSLVYLLDPISLLTRTYTLALFPPFVGLVNLVLDAVRPVAEAMRWMSIATLSYAQPVFYMSLVTFLVFAGIIALGRLAPRFWCRYLCPLGALLSLVSPLGRLRRDGRARVPGLRSVPEDVPHGRGDGRGRHSPCRMHPVPHLCGGLPRRPHRLPGLAARRSRASSRPDLSRRGFLYSVAGGVGLGFAVQQSPFTPLQNKQQLIRPPGALPESEFLTTCIRCGECMKSCLTNTLQPYPVGKRLGGPLDAKAGPPVRGLRAGVQRLRQGLPHPSDPVPRPGGEDARQTGDGRPQEGDVPGLGPGQAVPDLRRDLPLRCHRVPDHRWLPPPVCRRVPLQRLWVLRAALSRGGRLGHRRGRPSAKSGCARAPTLPRRRSCSWISSQTRATTSSS